MHSTSRLQSALPLMGPPSFDDELSKHRRSMRQALDAVLQPAVEHDTVLLTPSSGRLPEGLRGTLYRNGAGTHLREAVIEGDGLVTAARFDGGRVYHQSRFVRTRRYAATQRLLQGGGALQSGGWQGILPDSEANTSVLMVGGRLFALWEAAPPWELRPDTLETLGECTFDGQLRGRSWRGAQGFAAHPRWDAHKGEIWTFGLSYVPTARLTIYRMDEAARLKRVREVTLPHRYLVHDCGLTPNYMVFCLGPAYGSIRSITRRPRSLVGSIEWHPECATRVLLVPRDGRPETVIETEPFFQWHFAGAFEDGRDVFFDLVHFRSWSMVQHGLESFAAASSPAAVPYGRLWRYRAQLEGKRGPCVEGYPVSQVPMEFPTVDPRRQTGGYRYVYGAAARAPESGFSFTSVAKYDTWTGSVDDCDYGPGHSVSEPLFVPREPQRLGPDDDGWLLTYHSDLARARHELLVFDARAVRDGPVCVLPVPSIGSSFHGQWVPDGASGHLRHLGAGTR